MRTSPTPSCTAQPGTASSSLSQRRSDTRPRYTSRSLRRPTPMCMCRPGTACTAASRMRSGTSQLHTARTPTSPRLSDICPKRTASSSRSPIQSGRTLADTGHSRTSRAQSGMCPLRKDHTRARLSRSDTSSRCTSSSLRACPIPWRTAQPGTGCTTKSPLLSGTRQQGTACSWTSLIRSDTCRPSTARSSTGPRLSRTPPRCTRCTRLRQALLYMILVYKNYSLRIPFLFGNFHFYMNRTLTFQILIEIFLLRTSSKKFEQIQFETFLRCKESILKHWQRVSTFQKYKMACHNLFRQTQIDTAQPHKLYNSKILSQWKLFLHSKMCNLLFPLPLRMSQPSKGYSSPR